MPRCLDNSSTLSNHGILSTGCVSPTSGASLISLSDKNTKLWLLMSQIIVKMSAYAIAAAALKGSDPLAKDGAVVVDLKIAL